MLMKRWRGLFLATCALTIGILSTVFLLSPQSKAIEASSDFRVEVGSILELKLENCDASSSSSVILNFDVPTAAGQFKSACQDVFVNTNNPGYTLTVKSSGSNSKYLSGANTNAMLYRNPSSLSTLPVILAKSSGTIASPSVIPNDTWGYAVENLGGFNTTYTPNLDTDRYAQMTTTDTQIYKTTTWPLPRNDFKFYYGARVTPDTTAGSYATLITYTAVGEVVPCAWNDAISYDDPNCKDWVGMYQREMSAIEKIVADIIKNDDTPIGTALSNSDPVQISGLNYGNNWYRLSAAQLLAVCPACDTTNADYVVKYTTSTAGAVVSIPGRLVDGSRVHSFNYFGETDGIVYEGLLTAINSESTKTSTQWGEFIVGTGTSSGSGTAGGATYDAQGGLILGDKAGWLSIDQTKPVNNQFTIGFTVKGAIPQTSSDFPKTIVAISQASGAYLAWIGIFNNQLHVYSFAGISAKSGINTDQTQEGFLSKNITNVPNPDGGVWDFNDDFLNIYITALRKSGTETTKTNVYINGDLWATFDSGAASLPYATITIGDLRGGRNLKYNGALYDFTFYSEVLTEAQVKQNYNYSRTQLGY